MSDQMYRNLFPDVVPNSLSSEYINFEIWIKSRLGDDFATVELSPKQTWYILQEADQEFSSEMHTSYMKNYMSHFYGVSPNENVAGVKPNLTFSYLSHISDGIADLAGIGGNNRDFIGYITTVSGTQEYILDGLLYDKNGDLVDFTNGIEIVEVYYNDANATSRYIDTWSYYNIMAGEFGVQSALYNTMFAMLPINANVMMMQHVKFNNKLRLSNYSWEMYGNHTLRVVPEPRVGRRIYVRYRHKQPIDSRVSVTGSASGETVTASTNGISNFAQAKLNPIEWTNLNQIAKRWIRKYGLALCKEVLSFNRGKFKQVPFASENNMVELNWDMLAQQAKEEQKELKEQLRQDLSDIMNPAEMMKRDAEALKAQREQLEMVPLFPKWV